MIKEIQYQGYATEPSDYECADGQLTTSLNVISEDGQLKPVFQPFDLAELPDGYKVVYLHDANTFAHYILEYENPTTHARTYYWIDESLIMGTPANPVTTYPVASSVISEVLNGSSPSHALDHTFSSSLEIYNLNSVGNTLVILTSEGMHYFLWKSASEGYHYLGTHFPELHLSFGLQGEMIRSDTFDVDGFETVGDASHDLTIQEEYQEHVTNEVLAKVNKFIAEEATNNGRFLYPFLVRYAYRLYDGSLVMHSSPALMIAASNVTPVVDVGSKTADASHAYHTTKLNSCSVVGIVHDLDYAVLQQSQITALENWSDIITSVDVFITKPIYTYDQNGKITDVYDHNCDQLVLCKLVNQRDSYSQHECKYQFSRFGSLSEYVFGRTYVSGLQIPGKSAEKVQEEIRTASQFYLLHKFKISELTTTRTIINVAADYLQSLTSREVMTDDYDSHDILVPRYSFGYNARINLANLRKSVYNTYNVASLLGFSDGFIRDDDYSSVPNLTYQVYFKIKQDGREIVVQGGSYALSAYAPMCYLYYPNVNAYKAIIKRDDEYYEMEMEAHPMLNGAIGLGGWGYNGFDLELSTYASWNDITSIQTAPTPSTDAERIIEVPNKIYTSQVNNPFLFPVLGINTVGTGRILGISAAVKAMSQGQFGQFPLYAFTTEGVWALEVSSTGSYSARQPATRDVCISMESITQIDDAVLFATDRGIMLIQGSETKCITDTISSEAPFDVLESLPGIDQLHAKLGHDADTCLPVKPFLGFLDGCRMVYDYVHQHIIVFNPTMETVSGVASPKYTYAYVYSLKSKLWGMMFSDLSSPINSYPEALAMTQDNRLKSFSMRDEDAVCKALYVTRPLKLDAVDVYKTVSGLIQRGHFERGDVGTALYGSRDLYNWFLVWSSRDHTLRNFRGTPYKYFRIAGLATLTEGKTIFGASVDMEMKHTNKLR